MVQRDDRTDPKVREIPTDLKEPEVIPYRARVEIAPGSIIAGRYEIREKLGRGGMGAVWRAYDRELQVEVALKVILPEWQDNRIMMERFRREAATAREVTHLNVCRVYDLGEADGLRYLTMELIKGQTLRELLILSRGALEPARALSILQEVTEGLAAAHERKIVHHDLKPENVIVRADNGRAVVSDFGLARSLSSNLTSIPGLVGTEPYMSPEQLRGERLDERSDVFALGILGFETLTGRSPFGDGPSAVITSAILRDPPRPLEVPELPPGVAQAIGAVLSRAMAKRPKDRFASAAEFGVALAAAREGKWPSSPAPEEQAPPHLIPAPESPPAESPPAESPRPRGRQRAAIALIGLLALGSLAGIWLLQGAFDEGRAAPAPAAVLKRLAAVVQNSINETRPAVTVQRFSNGTGDAAWDGLTQTAAEAIRAGLRSMPQVRLIEPSPDGDPPEGARAEGAVWRVDGSILRVGPGIRLSAHFRATSGGVAGQPIDIDGDPSRLHDLLESLRLRALDELRLLWRDYDRRQGAIRGTESDAARSALLQYYSMIGPVPQPEHFMKGKHLLDEAISADPAYVPALVERGYLVAAFGEGEGTRAENLASALADVDRALQARPADPRALVMRCRLMQLKLNASGEVTDKGIATAISACGDALSADPSSPHVRIAFARIYDQGCKDDDAMAAEERALELDRSLSGRVLEHLVDLALQKNMTRVAEKRSRELVGLQEEEERLGARALSQRAGVPRTYGAHVRRAAVLVRLDRLDEAREELRKELEVAAAKGDNWAEAAAIRGLLRISERDKHPVAEDLKRRLRDLERKYQAEAAKDPQVNREVAKSYLHADPATAVKWLDKLGAPSSCPDALDRALFYKIAGEDAAIRRALDACAPSQQWERDCKALLERSR